MINISTLHVCVCVCACTHACDMLREKRQYSIDQFYPLLGLEHLTEQNSAPWLHSEHITTTYFTMTHLCNITFSALSYSSESHFTAVFPQDFPLYLLTIIFL
jgi:hypothetical protein